LEEVISTEMDESKQYFITVIITVTSVLPIIRNVSGWMCLLCFGAILGYLLVLGTDGS